MPTARSSSVWNLDHNKKGHNFFLSPYPDLAFTKCPKCDTGTKVRKIYLMVKLEPDMILSLGKNTKYCPDCDLIIVRRSQMDALITGFLKQFGKPAPKKGLDYIVFGTLDHDTGRANLAAPLPPEALLPRIVLFKNHWEFEI